MPSPVLARLSLGSQLETGFRNVVRHVGDMATLQVRLVGSHILSHILSHDLHVIGWVT